MALIENWNICINNDHSLLKRQNSFVEIIREISPIINRYASLLINEGNFKFKVIEIEDITQEAFTAIWKIIESKPESLTECLHIGEIINFFKKRINWTVNDARKKFNNKDKMTSSFENNNSEEDISNELIFINYVSFPEYYGFELDLIFEKYTKRNPFCSTLIYRYKIADFGITYQELHDKYEEYKNINPTALAVRMVNCMNKLVQFVQTKLKN